MKLYDPKKKDSFVMQFGFSYPETMRPRKKDLIKIYQKDEVLCTEQYIRGQNSNM